jgi:hypothetical protein
LLSAEQYQTLLSPATQILRAMRWRGKVERRGAHRSHGRPGIVGAGRLRLRARRFSLRRTVARLPGRLFTPRNPGLLPLNRMDRQQPWSNGKIGLLGISDCAVSHFPLIVPFCARFGAEKVFWAKKVLATTLSSPRTAATGQYLADGRTSHRAEAGPRRVSVTSCRVRERWVLRLFHECRCRNGPPLLGLAQG